MSFARISYEEAKKHFDHQDQVHLDFGKGDKKNSTSFGFFCAKCQDSVGVHGNQKWEGY